VTTGTEHHDAHTDTYTDGHAITLALVNILIIQPYLYWYIHW